MKISRVLPLVILALGLAGPSHAQAAGPTGGKLKPGNHANGQNRQPVLEALSKCNLTTEEKPKIQALVKARAENIKTYRDAHQGDTADPAALRTFVGEQQKAFMDGIKTILTPAQWDTLQAELKKILESMRSEREKAAGGATPPPPSKSPPSSESLVACHEPPFHEQHRPLCELCVKSIRPTD